MCLDCGCGEPLNDHGDPAHITFATLQAAAAASGISVPQALANINQTMQRMFELGSDGQPVAKAGGEPEQRYVLGIAYKAGKHQRITKGVDKARDYFRPEELERAAWSFMAEGPQVGAFHLPGTPDQGLAVPVESYIYRQPIPWDLGNGLVAERGDWLVGAILDPRAWAGMKAGQITGWSPQGLARRRRLTRPAP